MAKFTRFSRFYFHRMVKEIACFHEYKLFLEEKALLFLPIYMTEITFSILYRISYQKQSTEVTGNQVQPPRKRR